METTQHKESKQWPLSFFASLALLYLMALHTLSPTVSTIFKERSGIMNLYDAVMTIENGAESESEWIDAMQYLINSGTVWQLQGSFGRAAQWAIESGLCYDPAQEGVE